MTGHHASACGTTGHSTNPSVAAVDLGKTKCRVRIGQAVTEGPGSSGLAERGGAQRALDTVLATLALHPAERRAGLRTLSVGAAGAASAPDVALTVAEALSGAAHADVAVTSDIVTAHAGALGGAAGTVLVGGTGAVAVSIDRDGLLRRADGAGIWLGDEGSGRWIGQAGLASAIKAADGRGASTVLMQRAVDQFGPLDGLSARIGGAEAPERALASFAPAVLNAADAGDAIAITIRDGAAAALAGAARAAAPDDDANVAVLGGLVTHAGFSTALTAALKALGLRSASPEGDALDGAVLIGLRTTLPHERQVTRVRSTFPR